MKLSETGEFGLIRLLTGDLACGRAGVIMGVGDDAAVLAPGQGRWLLYTTDMMVEGVHFSLAYFTAAQVGKKAMAVNVSDIAAMGGRPAYAVISIALRPDLPVEAVNDLYAGLKVAAGEYGVAIVGGDTVQNPERLVINIALLGEVEAGGAVYRSGARPGDGVYVTGSLGAAAAGLYICTNPGVVCPPEAAQFCREAHCEPVPRLAAGQVLAARGVRAMDDISDGLAAEIHEICGASGTGCRIRAEDVPVDGRVREVAAAAGVDPLDWALFGGEDFELVFTADPAASREIGEALGKIGVTVRRVGEITPAAEGIRVITGDGREKPLPRGGYDHFK
ncbi:MAG: thiamine-phosphate kinase [Firmicutes bacterium]|nr:thiamine-phosphate kinase [Bacillota bacterium]